MEEIKILWGVVMFQLTTIVGGFWYIIKKQDDRHVKHEMDKAELEKKIDDIRHEFNDQNKEVLVTLNEIKTSIAVNDNRQRPDAACSAFMNNVMGSFVANFEKTLPLLIKSAVIDAIREEKHNG